MINPGKILTLFILIATALWGRFEVRVSDTDINLGDEVIMTFFSDTSDKFPLISDIAGVAIERTSNESSNTYINGKQSGSYKKHFLFIPRQNMTVPAYEMVENGKTVKSKPIKITVRRQKHDDPNDELYFKATASKKEVMVGEPFFVTLVYKQDRDLDVVDRRLTPPGGKHFWVEKKPIESSTATKTHEIATLKYIFTAQKAGELTIDPAHIKVGERAYRRDAWGMIQARARYKTLFSDPIKVKVKPLPEGVENVGDFSFKVWVDKRSSNEKDAVNLTIAIEGEGNIQDIPPFDLPMQNILVYDEEPKREHALKAGKYRGKFIQKFAMVGDKNYTVPALSFSFYSLKKKRVVTLQSKPIDIIIRPTLSAKPQQKVKVERKSEIKAATVKTAESEGFSGITLVIALSVGIALGFFARSFAFVKRERKSSKSLKISDEKGLLHALMPYAATDKEAKALIEKLSGNLYEAGSHSYDKKEVQKLLKRLDITYK